MPVHIRSVATLLALWLVFFAIDAHAQVDGSDVLDSILTRYQTASSGWAEAIVAAATWLFWTLVVISMVWTFGMMALRKADIGEFFAEFLRFTIFTGFFWWLLTNGPNFASSIYASLRQLGGKATGLGSALSPSGVVDIGFAIFDKVIDNSSVWSPVNSAAGILIACVILVILALVGVNMLLLLVSGWILAYGGVFFLGFGGSRWTSDMAINYYKTVLGVAAQLFVMVLIVGIGKTFLDDYYNRMSAGVTIKEIGVMLIVSVILLMLVNKLPALVAGIITGASIGGAGVGQLGAGTALGATGMAAAAAAMGGAALAAGAASAAGGASAIMAAFSKAKEHVSAGTDVLSAIGGGASMGGGGSAGSGGDSSNGGTPFAQAAGFASSSGSGMSTDSSLPTGQGDNNQADQTTGGDQDRAGQAGGQPGAQAAPAEGGAAAASGGMDGASSATSGNDENGPANQTTVSDQAKGGRPEGQQPSSAGAGSSRLASAASALSRAGRIAADAGVNLAKGTAEVAKAKVAGMRDAAMERIADTTGGKIAAAIQGAGSSTGAHDLDDPQEPGPRFENDSLAPTDATADPESEVAAFANRERDDKTA
jgi:type IV secretion system protein VirB6/type IV secretion system protein TrbL